ncbi:MAG: c-type cytochrome [Opitutus sp.]|nr:c-type cytochrome [Opitutus sp.]
MKISSAASARSDKGSVNSEMFFEGPRHTPLARRRGTPEAVTTLRLPALPPRPVPAMTTSSFSRFFAFSLAVAISTFAADAIAPARVPWTTSAVRGSPEPPSAYRVERAFPQLTFAQPLEVAVIPGTDRLVVVEQGGKLRSFRANEGATDTDLFGDIARFDRELTDAYAITFHPRFSENRLVYVLALAKQPGVRNRENGTRIIRFKVTVDPIPHLDHASGQVIVTWLQGGHNGGNLRFGPDGMFYFGAGDAGPAEPPDPFVTGQDVSDLLGSIMRIDVDRPDPGLAYGIPGDNPFVGLPKARGEVWAYGLRNPWRIAFDPKSGELYAGDVGWQLWEMVYRIKRGGNYGWSLTEGGRQDVRPDRLVGPSPILPPLAIHPHEEAASVTGGEFYHGGKLPELRGAYLYGDWQTGIFWSLRADGDRVTEQRELCRTPLSPVGFGVQADGELLICDYAAGGLWRFARNPAASEKPNFPRTLGATGLFTAVAKQIPAIGVVPFEINASRWADHATAERWVAFPGDGRVALATKQLGVMPIGRWVFPNNTVLAKTYSLELERGNSATRRRIETQLLHYDAQSQQWGAYSYRWNVAQTDAELVPSRGDETLFEVKDANAPGGTVRQTWRFHSRVECLRCHNQTVNFSASFNALQLDRPAPGATGRQIDAFHAAGLARIEPRMADPLGELGSLEVRARSYLHANCSTCHRFNGGGAANLLLNLDLAVKEAKLIDEMPVQGDLGLPDARVVASGDPARSTLLYRMATEGHGHMPYLGSRFVDERGLLLVRDWIASLKSDAAEVTPAAVTQREGERAAIVALRGGDTTPLPSLLATGSGALSAVLAIVDGWLPAAVRAAVIAQGTALVDPLRRDLFERFLPPSQRRQVLGATFDRARLLAHAGDATRGRAVFAATCIACHRADGVGIEFGPDLSHSGAKWDRAALLEQIVAPNAVVDPAWQLATVELKGGTVKSGFITARDGDALTLRIAGGGTEKIPAGRILKASTTSTSLMPEGLLQNLTAAEAADLIAFLAGLK